MTSAVAALRPAGPRHAAALYNSDEDLRSRVLSFLRAGLEGGEAVVAVVSHRAEKIVSAGLGDDADRIRWGLPGLSYQHLGRASEAIRGYLAGRRAADAATRLLTESDLGGSDRPPGRMAAYLRSEMAATQLFGGYGYPWVCLYDRRRYTPEVLANVARVHPQVLGAGGLATGSADYVEPDAYLSRLSRAGVRGPAACRPGTGAHRDRGPRAGAPPGRGRRAACSACPPAESRIARGRRRARSSPTRSGTASCPAGSGSGAPAGP